MRLLSTRCAQGRPSSAPYQRRWFSHIHSDYADIAQLLKRYTTDKRVVSFVGAQAQLLQPEKVVICDGSLAEKVLLQNELVGKGTLIKLNEKLRPGSFLARSNPRDVARVEDRTFICCERAVDAGPTNNWKEPTEAKQNLNTLFTGAMKGRTLYVLPFSMGPIDSDFSRIGIQLTDSPYVVLNMRIMTRMGEAVWRRLENSEFVRAVHSVGQPIRSPTDDVAWPCNPENTTICHFPETREIFSFGSGYGGNALLGKKCFSLRIASAMARDEGWLAEHMLICGVTSPSGVKKYFAASFPSACGKTNLAMLRSALPGWKVECVGDDIAWMRFSEGNLRAINPESGFFGVAPGTSFTSNPNAMETIQRDTLFTNVALTNEGDIWWEGMTGTPPDKLIDWNGNPWSSNSKTPAAHPNARFTVAASQSPIIDDHWEDPKGVPISAILFGGRRATNIPLIYGARSWEHGVFLGSIMSSETTAAATGKVGQLRHDPFAMLPFCGYNMGDYFGHWLNVGKKNASSKLPGFYYVNWFRKNESGDWLWPGFGDNIRVLKWIFERSDKSFVDHPIGKLPQPQDLDLSNLSVPTQNLKELLNVDRKAWGEEVQELETYYKTFGDRLPPQLSQQLATLKHNLTH